MPRSVRAYRGPARTTAGTATSSPYPNVRPTLAWNRATSAVGAGCGGRKPCSTESAASRGRPTYRAGSRYWYATENSSGTTSRKPTL